MINPNYKNCDKSQMGTGLVDCLAELGYPTGLIRTAKNWRADVSTDTMDKDYFVEQIQKGNFVPFLGARAYTQNTPETTFSESDNGIKLPVRNGKPEFQYEYVKTVHYNKIAYSHNSYRGGNVILTFDNGAIFLAETTDKTQLKGFDLAMQNTASFMFKTGSEPGKTMLTIQLENEDEYNLQGVVLSREQLGFNINTDIFGVIETNITLDEVSAGNTINASVNALANGAVNIEGLAANNLRVIIEGTAEAPASISYNDVDGKYEITTTTAMTAGDEVYVELYDTDNDVNVAIANELLYKGKSSTATVVA